MQHEPRYESAATHERMTPEELRAVAKRLADREEQLSSMPTVADAASVLGVHPDVVARELALLRAAPVPRSQVDGRFRVPVYAWALMGLAVLIALVILVGGLTMQTREVAVPQGVSTGSAVPVSNGTAKAADAPINTPPREFPR